MTGKTSLQSALEALRGGDSFLVTTHISPDGDAIGGMLGLRLLLRDLGKTAVTCACADPAPRVYRWLPGAHEILNTISSDKTFDTAVIVDVARLERLGAIADAVKSARNVIVLDHHLETEPCGDINFIDPTYAAASEIVAELYDVAGLPIPRTAAECIYVGLTTDTGGFRYSNTNARAHRTAARLIESGIDAGSISSRVFDEMSLPKMQLLRRMLDRMEISPTGRFASSWLTWIDFQETGAEPEDVEGLVNYLRNVDGITAGVLCRETEPGVTKISMRARSPVNAAECLRAFGGGGHAGAAGATLELDVKAAREQVISPIQAQVENLVEVVAT